MKLLSFASRSVDGKYSPCVGLQECIFLLQSAGFLSARTERVSLFRGFCKAIVVYHSVGQHFKSSLRWIFGTLCKFHSAWTALTKPQRYLASKKGLWVAPSDYRSFHGFFPPSASHIVHIFVDNNVRVYAFDFGCWTTFSEERKRRFNVGQRNFLK